MTHTDEVVEKLVEEWDELIKVSTKLELRNWLREALATAQSAKVEEVIYEVRKVLAVEGVLSMSVEKALAELQSPTPTEVISGAESK